MPLQHFYDDFTYTYEMTLNPVNDVISYSDFDMVSNINETTITQYETDLELSNLDIVDDNPSLDIDLSLYGFDIVRFEGGFYIPLYLANLFFTGSYINVYEMNDLIYVIDNFSDMGELINNYEKNDQINASDISSHTKNYLALYFDYFYGLKAYKNIDTYIDVLDKYEFEAQDNFNSLHKELERFIKSQDDLHTSIISAGYLAEDYRPSNVNSNKLNNYLTGYNSNQCYNRTSEINYKNYGDKLVIEVNGFSLETRTLLKPVMEIAKNYDDIIIDVSCNPGGNLIGVIELVSYMTNEEILVSYINPITGCKTIEYYETTTNDYLNKNFYVYTSSASYSAANLFTSIVKDQELALIIGRRSGGGASAITYTVLPDGAIIVNSSNFTLINKDNEVIEDGIEVDIDYNDNINWNNIIDYLNNVFTNTSEILIDKETTSNSITYHININRNFDMITLIDYQLSVYDNETNELISEGQFTRDEFSYVIPKVVGESITYRIEITVDYKLMNHSNKEIIYQDVIDVYSDAYNYN